MTNTLSLFEQALLAEASYAKFNSGLGVEDALTASDFSETQAAEFVTHWRVAAHIPDTTNGFSATLFESLDNPGQFNLAIRGSVEPVDFQADIADIFLEKGDRFILSN